MQQANSETQGKTENNNVKELECPQSLETSATAREVISKKTVTGNPIPVSFLMATYHKDNPDFLDEALRSIFAQTVSPLECVLVIDGPINAALEAVVDRYSVKEQIPLLPVRLPENRGLAEALNAGLDACRGEFIARMDSDDISMKHRLASQWDAIRNSPRIDVMCAWHAEFDDNPEQISCIKKTKPSNRDILAKLKWRNVISHPTIVFRKDAVKSIGGYRSKFGLLEDWDLYVRLALNGAQFASVQEPLVKVRATHLQRTRRSGLRYVYKHWLFRWSCYKSGFLSAWELIFIGSTYGTYTLLPAFAKRLAYKIVRAPSPSPQQTAAWSHRKHGSFG